MPLELKKKRKKGGKINQVYYVTECGITKHASFFSKIDKLDILQIKRDLKLKKLGL